MPLPPTRCRRVGVLGPLKDRNEQREVGQDNGNPPTRPLCRPQALRQSPTPPAHARIESSINSVCLFHVV